MNIRVRLGLVAILTTTACTSGSSRPAGTVLGANDLDTIMLRDDADHTSTLKGALGHHSFTALVFFAADCPVLKAHDARIREIVSKYESSGVAFAAIVSEVDANVGEERAAAKQRGWSMPFLEDHGAALANALGVEYSTHTVLLDRDGRVYYSGALDSDRVHMTTGATPWLRDAIDETLAGRPVKKERTEALGCPLRKR